MTKKYVLVAVRPEDEELVLTILGGHFDLIIRNTLKEAKASLASHIGLIICGVHFDQGAMFELLSAARAQPLTKSVPFFLVLREETRHSANVIDGIRCAASLRGVDTFIDLKEMKTRMTQEQMIADLRALVSKTLASKG